MNHDRPATMALASTPAPASTSDDSFSLQWFLDALRKNWILSLSVFVAICVATAFYTLRQTKIFQARATLQIDPNPVRPLGKDVQGVVDMGTGAYWSNQEYYNTQYKVIQSRKIAQETVRALGLHRDPTFVGRGPKPGEKEVPVETAADILRGRLLVEPIKDSRLVTISVQDPVPARAQRIVNKLSEIYIEQNIDRFVDSTNSAVEWLGQQLDKLKSELDESELALHQYKQKNSLLSVSFDDQSNMLRAEMSQLNTELTRVRSRVEHLAARFEVLRKLDLEDPEKLPAEELLANAIISDLRKGYLDARRDLQSLLQAGKGENHPESRAAAARITATRAALVREIQNVRGSIEHDLVAAKREADGLRSLFHSAEKRALDLNLLEMEYGRLERSKNNTEKLYSLVLDRTKESGLSGLMRFNNIRVVDAAELPKSPVKPSITMNFAIGGFLGLLLGFAVAFGRELMDRSVKSPEQLESEFHVTFMGLLPKGDGGAPGKAYGGYGRRAARRSRQDVQGPVELLAHADSSSSLAEASRAIRTNLLFMSPDKPHRTILVTSAGPSEGKSTVACCVAIAMAQAGQRVLLVDCDLRRPRLHRIFNEPNTSGVTSALIEQSTLAEGVRTTQVDNLSLLTSGPQVANPAELIQSEKFSSLLNELSQRFDRVVIDSPPVVPVTDATILSRRVDGVLLVVRAFQTRRDLLQQALRTLRDVNARILGAVLNDVDGAPNASSYYRYYAYGYGTPPESTTKTASAA